MRSRPNSSGLWSALKKKIQVPQEPKKGLPAATQLLNQSITAITAISSFIQIRFSVYSTGCTDRQPDQLPYHWNLKAVAPRHGTENAPHCHNRHQWHQQLNTCHMTMISEAMTSRLLQVLNCTTQSCWQSFQCQFPLRELCHIVVDVVMLLVFHKNQAWSRHGQWQCDNQNSNSALVGMSQHSSSSNLMMRWWYNYDIYINIMIWYHLIFWAQNPKLKTNFVLNIVTV